MGEWVVKGRRRYPGHLIHILFIMCTAHEPQITVVFIPINWWLSTFDIGYDPRRSADRLT